MINLRRLFWSVARPVKSRDVKRSLEDVNAHVGGEWYYHLDFGYGHEVRPELKSDRSAGMHNWRFLSSVLQPLNGLRILNIGCNAGLYDLLMAESGASVVGIDRQTVQAEFLRRRFSEIRGGNYSQARFIGADVTSFDLVSLGQFDLVTLFCVAYHLGEAANHVFDQLSKITPAVVMQGNLPRLTSRKYQDRPFQELAGIEGMSSILKHHGFFDISIHAPPGYRKPVVIGRRVQTQATT